MKGGRARGRHARRRYTMLFSCLFYSSAKMALPCHAADADASALLLRALRECA